MPRGFRWVTRIATGQAVSSGSQSCVDLLAPYSFVVDNLKGHTVTRIVAKIVVFPDTVDQGTHTFWGIAVVNADAAVANAFPDSDIEADNVRWLVRDFSVNRVTSLTDRSQFDGGSYDLRAQALLRSDQEELHLIVDTASGGGVIFSMMTRVLLRVP